MPRPDQHDHEDFDDTPFDETDFDREIELVRAVAADPVELVDAPGDLWSHIAAAAAAEMESDPRTDPGGMQDAAPDAAHEGVAPVVDLSARRRRWTTVLISAAAVVAVIAGAGRSRMSTRSVSWSPSSISSTCPAASPTWAPS